MTPENNKQNITSSSNLSDIYDAYAPAVYGKILGIVQQAPIANKIFEKVFIEVFRDKYLFHNKARPPLITMLNQSRKKSHQAIKALSIINDCCAGSTISIAVKNQLIAENNVWK